MPMLEPCPKLAVRRIHRETQAAREQRVRDRHIWYATNEGKQAIARAAIKHLRYHVPRELMLNFLAQGQDVMQRMQYQHIYVDPDEFQAWHEPQELTPTKDELWNALRESTCSDGQQRFTWRWDPARANYADGTRKWQYMLTDMQVAPDKCHRSYRIMLTWLQTPEHERGPWEDVNFHYGPEDRDFR